MPYKQYEAVYNALITSLKAKKVDKYHYLALGIITVNFAIYWKFIQNFLAKSILVHCAEVLDKTQTSINVELPNLFLYLLRHCLLSATLLRFKPKHILMFFNQSRR